MALKKVAADEPMEDVKDLIEKIDYWGKKLMGVVK